MLFAHSTTWISVLHFLSIDVVGLQVNFNEPLSMLQRLTEDLEYHELLDKAARCESSLEQMCLVAAFSVSSYSTTVHRTAKPFNPLLGETYELDRLEEFGYRSLCEQVWLSCRENVFSLPPKCSRVLDSQIKVRWCWSKLNNTPNACFCVCFNLR